MRDVPAMRHVYVRLMGGLGNQLFQYAAARALAARRKATVKLDISDYETNPLRNYALGNYPINASIASKEEIAVIRRLPYQPRWSIKDEPAKSQPLKYAGIRLLKNIFLAMGREGQAIEKLPCHYREHHFHFHPDVLRQGPPIFLEGFWQSARYFEDIADTLRQELTPITPMTADNQAMAEKIRTGCAVSIHVRRGDYVDNARTHAFHGLCSLDYYRTAIAHLADKIPDANLFAFSDDPEWTRDNLSSDLPTTYVCVNNPEQAYRDIQLMSLCDHHIIANSSFSWWGAWLNPSREKIVIGPARWFTDAKIRYADIMPSDWIRI